MTAPTPYRDTFRVRAAETDPRGRASVLTVADWMQEMADRDARNKGFAVDDLFARGLTWVLARLLIRLESTPRWRETVTAETWPSSAAERRTTRDFRFLRETGAVAAVATTSWRILDLKSRKVVDIPREIRDLVPDAERVLTFGDGTLARPESPEFEKIYDVRLSDLDINRHVNNVVYLDWALEPVPLDLWREFEIAEFELGFRSEGRLGDRVVCLAERIDDGDAPAFRHQVLREKDGREMAVARSAWRRLQP